MKDSGYQILWFIGLVFAQVAFFNNISFAYVINPYLYIYLVVVFPNRQSHTASVLISFLLGFAVDAFSNSWGVHTVATTAVGYMQPVLLSYMAKPEQLDKPRPSLNLMHGDFLKYAAILIVTHHLLLFSLEAFSFSLILPVLVRTFVSSAITFVLVYVLESIRKPAKS